jgi:hypothetical protein
MFGASSTISVVVLVVVPYVQLAQQDAQTTTAVQTTTAAASLGDKKSEDVLKITVARADESFTFTRAAYREDWKLETMPDLELDQDLVEAMVSNAAAGLVTQDITNDLSNLSQYGLDKPAAKVTITFKDGASQSYYLGTMAVTGTDCYGYREGVDRVVLFPKAYYDYVMSPLYTFAKVEDFSVVGADATMVRVSSPDKVLFEVQMIGAKTMSVGDYYITEPYKVLAVTDFSIFTDALDSLALNGRVEVGSDNLAKYGLDKPAFTLDVSYGDTNVTGAATTTAPATTTAATTPAKTVAGATTTAAAQEDTEQDFTLYIGNKTESGDYYVCFKGKPGVFTMTSTALDFVVHINPYSLVNRMFMLYSLTQVDSVTLDTPSDHALLSVIHPDTTKTADDPTKETFTLDGATVTARRQTPGTKASWPLPATASCLRDMRYPVRPRPRSPLSSCRAT